MSSNKTTIYKFAISVSDLDQDRYESLFLTVAQHPSESLERMMARVLAFCLNAQEHMVFTAGLSTPDEPDIWLRGLDGQLLQWIDVGEPGFERIKKASRAAKKTQVYTFNSKSDVWWRIESEKFAGLPVEVFQFPWGAMQALAALVERTMDFSITISGATLYLAAAKGDVEIECRRLQ